MNLFSLCVCACKEPDREDMIETRLDQWTTPEDLSDECSELVLRVVRGVGVGLGMSIAGGVGTTAPFKDGDEVD